MNKEGKKEKITTSPKEIYPRLMLQEFCPNQMISQMT